MHAENIARKDFSLSFRGFDQHEVRAYLAQLAAEVAGWRERVEQLQSKVAELESVPPPELDEVALEAALGREATRVIHAAREAGADIRARAEQESAAIRAEIEGALASRREEADAQAATILADATRERDRVLEELAMQRSSLVEEIERLQDVRLRLTGSFEVARQALDAAVAEVSDAGAAIDTVVAPPPVESPAPIAVEREPEPEPEPEPPARRSSSLKLVRPEEEGRGTPVAPPVENGFEAVRIIRPEPKPEQEPEPPSVVEAIEVLDALDALDAEDAAEVEEVEEVADDGAVDGLFARLRADRAEKVANAEALLSGPATEPPAAGPEPEPSAPSEQPDLALLAARDETVAADERALVRALKRSLADEQNEVLDGLRRLRGAPTLDSLLPERKAHDARFDAVLAGGVAAAAAAGGAAAGGDGGRAAPVAAELGRSIAADLRARVERAVEEASGDVETLAEAVSAAYREWKTSRAEPLARDAIAAGFASGMYAAASGTVRWVVDPAEGGCPDCDDNVLAGATAKGSAFPTGQLHPPAHAGCRCVVVAV